MDSSTSVLLEHRELINNLYKLHTLGLESDEDDLKEPIYCRIKEQLRDYLTGAIIDQFLILVKLVKEDLKSSKSDSIGWFKNQ